MAERGFGDIEDLRRALDGVVRVEGDGVEVQDAAALRGDLIDNLAYSAVFGSDDVKAAARWLIRSAAPQVGAFPASIHDLYMASGKRVYANKTAPAINVRGLTFDTAGAIFRAAKATDTKIVLFELARSEMGYTDQRPGEYATGVLAGAIKEGHQGPVFIQGDHYQANAKKFATDPEGEIEAIRALATEAIGAGYLNIDIDASTLVDIELPTLAEQQRANYERTAELTAAIRAVEPAGVTVSLGGEIGEVGKENSTVADLDAFMTGYQAELARLSEQVGKDLVGISKISVQTGTSHGGVVLPDGTIADVSVDFETLAALSEAGKTKYGIGGAVQHGASTLPEVAFGKFAEANAVEVHLATAFQNKLFDSEHFPVELKQKMYEYLAANHSDERKPNMTDAQFYYTTRKRGYGPLKQEMWDMPAETRAALMAELRPMYELIMQRLGVAGSAELVDGIVKPVVISVPAPDGLRSAPVR